MMQGAEREHASWGAPLKHAFFSTASETRVACSIDAGVARDRDGSQCLIVHAVHKRDGRSLAKPRAGQGRSNRSRSRPKLLFLSRALQPDLYAFGFRCVGIPANLRAGYPNSRIAFRLTGEVHCQHAILSCVCLPSGAGSETGRNTGSRFRILRGGVRGAATSTRQGRKTKKHDWGSHWTPR